MEFNLTAEFLTDLYILQKGQCALTGWIMETQSFTFGKNEIRDTMSLDRIDSRIGYVRGNVQLVCWQVNIAKSDLLPHDFMNLCKSVIKWQRQSFGKLKVTPFR